jgi:hypothetical protein
MVKALTMSSPPGMAMASKAVLIAHQAGERAEPERVVAGVSQRHDAVADDAGVRRLVEDAEVLAVEADQPFVRGQPEVAVGGLGEAAHGAVGESALDGPGAADVLLDRAIGGEGGGGGGDEERRDGDEHSRPPEGWGGDTPGGAEWALSSHWRTRPVR